MSLYEDTNPRALKHLLAEIHNATTVLPRFQRDFVWEPNDTQSLIVSIANNYPAGSILRVRDTARLFAVREFEGAAPLDGRTHTFLVLDGQQRLTSLYQAFYGVGEHRYYLDLRKLVEGTDFEEAVFHFRATARQARTLESLSNQIDRLVLPLSVLKDGTGGFLTWLLQATERLPSERRAHVQDDLRSVHARWIEVIGSYQFPVVTLSNTTDPAALCTIFETLNRTGVKLSPFELLNARFWPQDIHLSDLWDQAKVEHPVIEQYDVDPYYVLQGVALASLAPPSCRRGDVLNLNASAIRQWWELTAGGLSKGLKILRDDCGVMSPKWLPYQTMLPPLAAILARFGTLRTPEAGVHREKLKRWFWCSVFGQVYENAPNSQSAKDVVDLTRWLEGGEPPEEVQTFRFDPRMLREVTPRQRAVYRGVMCVILLAGARDFHTREVITSKLIEDEGIDSHHVFPAADLERRGIGSARIRDCVLNRALIDRTTNRMISDRAPSDYLGTMRNTPEFPFEAVLVSQLLPATSDSPLLRDDYEAFLDWRQERLWQEIRRLTGATAALNLAAEEEMIP